MGTDLPTILSTAGPGFVCGGVYCANIKAAKIVTTKIVPNFISLYFFSVFKFSLICRFINKVTEYIKITVPKINKTSATITKIGSIHIS